MNSLSPKYYDLCGRPKPSVTNDVISFVTIIITDTCALGADMAASSASILSRIECTGSCMRSDDGENDSNDDLPVCFVDESSNSPLEASVKEESV